MDRVALPETCCPGEVATIWIRSGYAAYLGPSLRLDPHSGSVHCVAVGIDAPFTVRVDADQRTVRSAFIPARTRHQVVAESGRMLFCYLPTLLSGVERCTTDTLGAIGLTHRHESALIDQMRQANPLDPAALLRRIADTDTPAITDARIRATVRTIRADPAGTLGAPALATEVGLSTSRFLHLFSAQTGTSLRRYRLWSRMMRVAAAAERGHDLTTAASDAGFASPSHFSDAFHAMFGLTATTLLANGTRLIVGNRSDGPIARPPVRCDSG
ncbi:MULTISPECIES: AraC family transcriptional regulator [unclassified Nocardia]|uniref:AraC family transcriptional regulator n=1 Tax=unclassified Nocardia TaxID=2637762 RepID=UPI00278C2313|nr:MULTISPECIES: AraC family transcriptional regulator [unclassified Nocardia]